MTDVIVLSESWRAWGLKPQGDVVTASVQRSQGKVKFYCTEAWNGHVVVIPELGADSPSRRGGQAPPGAPWLPVDAHRDTRGVSPRHPRLPRTTPTPSPAGRQEADTGIARGLRDVRPGTSGVPDRKTSGRGAPYLRRPPEPAACGRRPASAEGEA